MKLQHTTGVSKSAVALLLVLALAPIGPIAAEQHDEQLRQQLLDALELRAPGSGAAAFLLPDSEDYAAIPQDPNNPVTSAKVRLGKFLFHETAVGTETTAADRKGTYSCATCHHANAGFKAGLQQGIGDGGSGFARNGANRRLSKGINPDALEGDPAKPDFQPVTSPSVLNAAYQSVMLWDGSLGNTIGGLNSDAANLLVVGPAGARVNEFELLGLETQVIAGTRVHRLRFDNNSILQTNSEYEELYLAAYPDGDTGYIPPGSSVTPVALGAAKAIAAFERTILANRSPFQRWLRGNYSAMNSAQLRGALLFFGKANCVACHTGPALSSALDANAGEMFFNVGFEDFDTRQKNILGTVPEHVSRGRGHFTGNPTDNYKFKIPQLYNLKNTYVLGHGASFKTLKQVISYKNAAVPQKKNTPNLASEFRPLNLTTKEMIELEKFVKNALYDPALSRYQPDALPSGNCTPAADFKSVLQLGCW